MDETSFQLPVTTYEVLVRIIQGYRAAGAGKEAVSVTAVADALAMKGPNISANNKFLLSMEILERSGREYRFTPSGQKLAEALDFYGDKQGSPEVQSAWEDIVTKNDFLQRVTSAVRIRGKMEVDAFARHIALTSGAPNQPRFIRGARSIITILQTANVLEESEDGILSTANREGETHEGLPVRQPGVLDAERTPVVSRTFLSPAPMAGIPVSVIVQIALDTTDDELGILAQKIRHLSRLLSAEEAAEEQSDDSTS